jgi:hypothetical protein
MKKLIGAFIILAVIFGSAITINQVMNNNIDEITEVTVQGRNYVEQNGNTNPEITKEIVRLWEAKETFMAAFLPHGELDDIEIGFKNLTNYENQKLTDEYLEEINECINRLEHIKESEKVIIKNIF